MSDDQNGFFRALLNLFQSSSLIYEMGKLGNRLPGPERERRLDRYLPGLSPFGDKLADTWKTYLWILIVHSLGIYLKSTALGF